MFEPLSNMLLSRSAFCLPCHSNSVLFSVWVIFFRTDPRPVRRFVRRQSSQRQVGPGRRWRRRRLRQRRRRKVRWWAERRRSFPPAPANSGPRKKAWSNFPKTSGFRKSRLRLKWKFASTSCRRWSRDTSPGGFWEPSEFKGSSGKKFGLLFFVIVAMKIIKDHLYDFCCEYRDINMKRNML